MIPIEIPGTAVIIIAIVILAIILLGMTDPIELIMLAAIGTIAVGMYKGTI